LSGRRFQPVFAGLDAGAQMPGRIAAKLVCCVLIDVRQRPQAGPGTHSNPSHDTPRVRDPAAFNERHTHVSRAPRTHHQPQEQRPPFHACVRPAQRARPEDQEPRDGLEIATHAEIEVLKREKLQLKDELYTILKKASAA
jgi:hypothetical protein